MRKYPEILIPNEYLDSILGRDSTKLQYSLLQQGVILCDYCIEQYLFKNPHLGRYAGWLTDEKCPLHKHYWLKFWFLFEIA